MALLSLILVAVSIRKGGVRRERLARRRVLHLLKGGVDRMYMVG